MELRRDAPGAVRRERCLKFPYDGQEAKIVSDEDRTGRPLGRQILCPRHNRFLDQYSPFELKARQLNKIGRVLSCFCRDRHNVHPARGQRGLDRTKFAEARTAARLARWPTTP